MPKNILFFPDVYQEHGHWHPAISLAQGLSSKGHTVKYMGIADCKVIVQPYVSDLEDSFYTVFENEYPLGYTKSRPQELVGERWKPVHLWNIINGELDSLIEEFKPDLIVAGYFTSLEALLMYYKYSVVYSIKFMILTIFLRHPADDPGVRVIDNLSGMPEVLLRKIMEVYSDYYRASLKTKSQHQILFLGTGDTPIAPDVITVHDFVRPLKSAIEIIPCPREFDEYLLNFDVGAGGGRVEFIEPCVIRSIEPQHLSNVEKWDKGIPSEKLSRSDRRIIFATAGSRTNDYKDKARRLFLEMVKMMDLQGMQDYHLVISAGSDLVKEDWAQEGLLPDNVTVCSWVPQLDVLDYCAAAYIHGGLATIKECIYKGVPFIVLPLGKDQMDNALRVRRKSIAQTACAEGVGSDELQTLFLQAITNKQMESKLNDMRNLFNEIESSRLGVELIDSVLY